MSEIGELFERDPLLLTRENIDSVVDYFRKARAQFNLGVKDAGSTKKAKAPAKALVEVDLDLIMNLKSGPKQ